MAAMPHARDFLPLKDLVFRILVALSDGERHGWALVQALDEPSDGTRLLPGHLYRTLNAMLEDELVIESDEPTEPTARASAETARSKPGAAPTRFFRLTPLGVAVARAETARLESLVARSRAGRLLKARR
jgi:DNA-binding PadR family transcriptional regulator